MAQRSEYGQLSHHVLGFAPLAALLAVMFLVMFWLLPGQDATASLRLAKEQQYQHQIKSLTAALKYTQAQLERERKLGEGLQRELRDASRQIAALSKSLDRATGVRAVKYQGSESIKPAPATVTTAGSLVLAHTVASVPISPVVKETRKPSRYAPPRLRHRRLARRINAAKKLARQRARRTAALSPVARPMRVVTIRNADYRAGLPAPSRLGAGTDGAWSASPAVPRAETPALRSGRRVTPNGRVSRRRATRRSAAQRRAAKRRSVVRRRSTSRKYRRPRLSVYARLARQGVFGDSNRQ